MPESKPLAWGCLSLFGLPFLVGGVLGLKQGLAHLHDRENGWAMVVFGAVFLAVGLGLVLAGPIGAISARGRLRREQAAPDRPWLRRDDWAEGRVDGSQGRTGGLLWLSGVAWLAICVPVVWILFHKGEAPIFFQGLFGIGFPLVGVLMLVGGIRSTLRSRRFGSSCLTFDHLPVPPGGALSGRVDCGVEDQLEPVFRLVLQCTETWTEPGSGKSSSRTRTEVRWRDEYDCRGERSADVPDGSLVPVRFDLPADALPTGQGGRGTIAWKLRVGSELPGIDYLDEFEIPVYPLPAGEAPPTPRARPLPPDARRFPTGRLRIADDGGETRVEYPAALNPGLAMVPTGLLAVVGWMCWAWANAGMWWAAAPAGLFAALMLWAATRAWLVRTTVIARRGEVEVVRSLLGFAWRRVWRSGDLEDLELSSDFSANGNPWYKLSVRAPGQRREVRVGSLIESHPTAERVRDALRARLKG